jgi:hypothetical protein
MDLIPLPELPPFISTDLPAERIFMEAAFHSKV